MNPLNPGAAYHTVTQVLFLILLSGSAYGIFGQDALPGSELFAVLALAICAYAGGLLVNYFRLPPLVGMLAVGFLYGNLPFLSFGADISTKCASTLRNVSLAIILLKAGLGLDVEKLRVLKWIVFRLSFIPCLLEAGSIAFFSHALLGLPWIWASLLSFILSAVSAAVLVPGALALEEKKIGTVQGVPTLLLASVSLDNITALTGFIVIFSVLTSDETLTWTFCKRLLEPFVGLLLGALSGILLWYFPNKDKSDKNITWITGLLWQLIEPFLFSLIGAEVTISSLQNNIGYGTLVLFLGVFVRVVATVLALIGSGLNLKEKIFVSASWISKATVQAAVGSQALDYGKSVQKDELFQNFANQVLTMSALSIIMTAPLGAALMDVLGHRLLKKERTYAEVEDGDGSSRKRTAPVLQLSRDYGSCSQTEAETLKQHSDA